MSDWLNDLNAKRAKDAQRFYEQDDDLCMICHAYGADKRSLFIECLYAIEEVVPEAIELFAVEGPVKERHKSGYYLRVCKSCRGALLGKMQEWRNERVALRGEPKDHDGDTWFLYDEEQPSIPVRINGATVLMTEAQYKRHRESKE